jgi:Domain of unknown function (DUF1816)
LGKFKETIPEIYIILVMKLLNTIKDIITSYANNKDWWIEISTVQPYCTYYFGPFQNHQEAQTMCPGYIEDLQEEGAREIKALIKRCNPDKLTVCEE